MLPLLSGGVLSYRANTKWTHFQKWPAKNGLLKTCPCLSMPNQMKNQNHFRDQHQKLHYMSNRQALEVNSSHPNRQHPEELY